MVRGIRDIKDYLPTPPWEGPPIPRKWQGETEVLRNMVYKSIEEEVWAIAHYDSRAKESANLGDFEGANLYEHLKADEKHHLDELLVRMRQLGPGE